MSSYKSLTKYGECPGCGKSCQPDFAGAYPPLNGKIFYEYASCCDCKIMWEYERHMDENKESHYDVWEPINIENFDWYIPYECRDKS